MTIKKITSYLFFSGTADEAIELYKSALGAKVENLVRYEEQHGRPEMKGKVLNACLQLGEATIMLSDGIEKPSGKHMNVHVCLDFDTPENLDKAFDGLSAGGEAEMKPHDAFWGARFGACIDKFGINWMFNCPLKK